MSLISAVFPSDPFRENWMSGGGDGLVQQLCKASQFIRGIRVQMRFGELSRAPLRLVSLQIIDKVVKCDWLVRPLDPWDVDLSRNVQQRHASLQALRDAIDLRALLFDLMPDRETVYLRAYRESNYARELIIDGSAHRNDHSARGVHSIVMRAKILGFRFDIDGNALRGIPPSGVSIQVGSLGASMCCGDFS